MQEKLGSWVATIYIKPLRHSNKADAKFLELFNTGEAVQKITPKTVQFPNQDDIEFPGASISQKPIEGGPSGLGSASHVLVSFGDFPTWPVGVGEKFTALELVVLICG